MAELTEKKLEKLFKKQNEEILDSVDLKLDKMGKEVGDLVKRFDGLEKVIDDQTVTILNAVDSRLINFESKINRRIDTLEKKFSEKINKLTDSIDEFVGLYRKHEQELLFMKKDLDKIKGKKGKGAR